MKKYLFFCLFISVCQAQIKNPNPKSAIPLRPKLVVGIVVDQMRWDFLYRYQDRYTPDGFKRLLREGFTCENTQIPYVQTVTAAGHACIYTGSVPALNGMMGNAWFSREINRQIYCVEDTTVKTVGSPSTAGEMSPRNLTVTTIADELRMANNFQGKTIGIAIKDRGAILPAGHSANAAYWYDGSVGNFITSTYYLPQVPDWVQKFNDSKMPDKLYARNWNTLFALNTYTQSSGDDKAYEGRMSGETASVFPHKLSGYTNTNYGEIASTPYGNTLTYEFAKAALDGEKLGQGTATDFLTVSFSSTDYVGHRFGPNSVETEDTYLRLDKDLGEFFKWLDTKIGKGQYLLFLTADHGVSHTPGFLQENKLPGGWLADLKKNLNTAVEEKFGIKGLILNETNNQIYLNYNLLKQAGKSLPEAKTFIIDFLQKQPGIAHAYDLQQPGNLPLPQLVREMVINGSNSKRGGDIGLILSSGFVAGEGKGLAATHGQWYPYDSHIPMVFMGWNIKHGQTHTPTYMTDIAATIAALLHIQMPSGCIGKPVKEITD
jgi:predicted AlkP superfamily pyrophosphatase or phosphodiesterase